MNKFVKYYSSLLAEVSLIHVILKSYNLIEYTWFHLVAAFCILIVLGIFLGTIIKLIENR